MKKSFVLIALALVISAVLIFAGCSDNKKKPVTAVRAPIITSRGSAPAFPQPYQRNDGNNSGNSDNGQYDTPNPTIGEVVGSGDIGITPNPNGGQDANATAMPIVKTNKPAATPAGSALPGTTTAAPTKAPVPSPSDNMSHANTSIRSFLAYVPQLPVATKLEKEDDNGVTLSYKVDSDNTYEQVINAFANGGFTTDRSRMKKSDGTLVYTAKNNMGIMLRIESGKNTASISVYYDEAHLNG